MDSIYHEKQEGSLCGQHCLNNLLQGEYFSAVDLATIAQEMDMKEKERMAEFGMDTEDYRKFIQQPSSNMDDSGMFSVQVLTSALKIWNLNLVAFSSSAGLSVTARNNPVDQNAYICNFKEHWFTVRKLGHQWFNLNSLLEYPELISNTYLDLFLTQLQHEGYSIFVIDGSLPDCIANTDLKFSPIVQITKPRLLSEIRNDHRSDKNVDLQSVLKDSLKKAGQGSSTSRQITSNQDDDMNDDIRKAIELSMKLDQEEGGATSLSTADTENEQLMKALAMSLNEAQMQPSTSEPDMDEIRRRRLAYLDKKNP